MTRRLLLLTVLLGIAWPTPAAAQPTEVIEYYALDQLGSVRVVFDANGNIIGRMDYGPFGQSLSGGTHMPDRMYAGLFRDGEVELDAAGARSYQVRTGRFTTVDPAYAGLFEPQRWNRYAYALNSPIAFTDPDGLLTEPFRSTSHTICETFPAVCQMQQLIAAEQQSQNYGWGFVRTPTGWEPDFRSGKGWFPAPNGGTDGTTTDPGTGTPTPGPNPPGPNPPTPPGPPKPPYDPPNKWREKWNRFRACAVGYYGLDYYGMDPATIKWGAIAAAAGGIPKGLPKSFGIRVIRHPGDSAFTSVLSMTSLMTGGGGAFRTVANFGSKWAGPIAAASFVIDATALGTCIVFD